MNAVYTVFKKSEIQTSQSNRFNWLKDLETIPMNCTEAHVPTPRFLRVMVILVPRATRLICNRPVEPLVSLPRDQETTGSGDENALWPVPYACAQPYQPGSRSHGQLFRPYCGTWLCACVRYWAYPPRSWYVCFNCASMQLIGVNFVKFIWAHRSIFLLPSPYACRGRATTCLRWSWGLKQCLQPPRQLTGLIDVTAMSS